MGDMKEELLQNPVIYFWFVQFLIFTDHTIESKTDKAYLEGA
jgi:hypothetical protein